MKATSNERTSLYHFLLARSKDVASFLCSCLYEFAICILTRCAVLVGISTGIHRAWTYGENAASRIVRDKHLRNILSTLDDLDQELMIYMEIPQRIRITPPAYNAYVSSGIETIWRENILICHGPLKILPAEKYGGKSEVITRNVSIQKKSKVINIIPISYI